MELSFNSSFHPNISWPKQPEENKAFYEVFLESDDWQGQ